MRALPLLVTACAFCCSIADTASLPSLPAPKNWLAQHRALLSSARTLQGDSDGASASAAPPPSWRRLWDELRATQQLAYSAPASVLSLGLTASELVIPRLRGNLFDAAVTPGAAFAPMWPTVSAPYPGASRALLSHLRRPYSHVRAPARTAPCPRSARPLRLGAQHRLVHPLCTCAVGRGHVRTRAALRQPARAGAGLLRPADAGRALVAVAHRA